LEEILPILFTNKKSLYQTTTLSLLNHKEVAEKNSFKPELYSPREKLTLSRKPK